MSMWLVIKALLSKVKQFSRCGCQADMHTLCK